MSREGLFCQLYLLIAVKRASGVKARTHFQRLNGTSKTRALPVRGIVQKSHSALESCGPETIAG